jgi:hypothetical protein
LRSSGIGEDRVAVEGDGDGALEQFQAHDDVIGVFDAEQEAGESGEGPVVDIDALAFAEEFHGLEAALGVEDALDGFDFGVGDGGGRAGEADEALNAGEGDDARGAVKVGVEEDIAGEEGKVEGLGAVGPAAPGGVERKKFPDSAEAQGVSDGFFGLRGDAESVPPGGILRRDRGWKTVF